jgi:hypothetical protein
MAQRFRAYAQVPGSIFCTLREYTVFEEAQARLVVVLIGSTFSVPNTQRE